MDYVIDVVSASPLLLRFGFQQPSDAEEPAFVPRLLRPLGYFVEVVVRGLSGEVMYRTTEPKVEAKLDPSEDQSYISLEPGYSYGALLEESLSLPAGDYVLSLRYSNRQFTGSRRRPVGELRHEAAVDVRVDEPQ